MTPFHTSLAVWMGWGLLFLVLEMAAFFDVVPWNTLSWTVRQIEARHVTAALVVAGGLFVLILHLVIPRWPRGQQKIEDTEGDR